MRKILALLAVPALFAFPAMVMAQAAHMQGPPKVLEIVREDSKPGKSIAHRKHEAAWTQAFIKAGYPHNLTISSVTGPDQDWFMTGFDSFAELEKVNDKFETPAFSKIMDTFSPKESEFVSESRFIFATYRPDLSYKPDFQLGEYKYFNVVTVRYKIGAGSGPEEIAKIIKAAHEKGNQNDPSVVYQVVSGMPVGTYLYFTPVKSLASWDETNKAFGDALKEGGFYDAVAKFVDSAEYRLFAFNPRLSYVSDDVAKANPSFWHPKPEMAATSAKKAAPVAQKETKSEKK